MNNLITLYSDNLIKTKFPNSKVLLPMGINVNNIDDYACVGAYNDDIFHVSEVYPLKKMTCSVQNILRYDEKTGRALFKGHITMYQNGMEIPYSDNVSVSGVFYNLYKDAVYKTMGYWKNTKNSEIFVVTEYEQIIASSLNLLKTYLKRSLVGLNVATTTINRVVTDFEFETIDLLKNEDPRVSKYIKTPEKLALVKKRLTGYEEREKAFQYFAENNISISSISKIIDYYGNSSYSIVKNNPNSLFPFGLSIKDIDRISMREGLKYNNPERIKGAILRYIEYKSKNNGDLYVDSEEFGYGCGDVDTNFPFSLYVLKSGLYEEALTAADVKAMLKVLRKVENKIVVEKDLVKENKKSVYLSSTYKAELNICKKIKELNSNICRNFVPEKDILSFLGSRKGFELDPKQEDAVKMVFHNNFSILSGSPGTGKTQTTQLIVSAFQHFFPNKKIALCAPTGKASQRMSEVIGLPAMTIHRKLNMIPGEEDDSIAEITEDLLIIDETSMIDINLFNLLLSHISDNTSILLVGDYNQLPSVGPGLVLRDLIDSGIIASTMLTTIFRQQKDSDIINISKDILAGSTENISKRKKNSDFIFYDINGSDKIASVIYRYVKQMHEKQGVSLSDIQIITPANKGKLGTIGLNSALRDYFNPPASDKNEVYISPLQTFRRGDKVIQTRNNYDLNIFNGEIGIITVVDDVKDTIDVDFNGVTVTYSREDMADLKLAYAITVHRSQGSEFKYVIMPMVMDHSVINNKNLLYTAITRARKKFILVGQPDALDAAAKSEMQISRKSQLKMRLRG